MAVPEGLVVWGLAGEELVGEDFVWQTACASLQEVTSTEIMRKEI